MKNNIAIFGSGSMGCALALLLAKNGNNVKMWSPFKEEEEMINTHHEHLQRLPGIKIPIEVVCSVDEEFVLKDSKVAVLVVPSQTIRETSKKISKFIKKDTVVVCCSKGIEEGSCKIMSEIIKEELPVNDIVVLSGPSHAEEIAKNIPTTLVAASENRKNAEFIQELFMTPRLRVYTNPDIIGVELGGALKNIIALCAGISDGLGYGDNTKAALMTRGLTEIARLGIKLGAKSQTFSGLTGIGDLIVTCTSPHSRNRRAGIMIGQGKSAEQALKEINMVVEGYATTKPAYELSRKHNISMPITTEAYKVLFEGKEPQKAVNDLMTRSKTHEIEDIAQIIN